MKLLYNKYKSMVEAELKEFFLKKRMESKLLSPELHDAVCRAEEFTLRGGKRIRAVLAIIGYLAAGGNNLKEITRFSIAFELMHSFFLIHDDIIDNDLIRRGGPSLHASYYRKYDKRTSESLAIIVGDLISAFSFEPVLESRFDLKIKQKALNQILDVIKKTILGQMLDIVSISRDVNEAYIGKIHYFKTARYTISGPLIIGAEIAGANKKLIDQLEEFGKRIGKAFQLQDDILGIFGDENKLGKPVGSDIIEGKKTLLVIKAESEYINKRLGKDISKGEIEKIRKIIIDSGSLVYSETIMKKLILEAKEILLQMDIRDKEKKFLSYLIDYLEKRRT
jgi:geranylgeranyl diphosphate synthase, type I